MSQIVVKPEIEIIYSAIVNFAMQQNHVPVIRKLTLKNISGNLLNNVLVEIIPEPEFAIPWSKKFDLIPMDELIDIGPVNIKLNIKYLSQLTERYAGNFILNIKADDKIIFTECYNIDVLAFDQWNGVGILPEMLAAFVTPNHPEIAKIIIRASAILMQWTGKPSFDEYQSVNPDRVRKQMAAIYEAIAELNLVYCSVPASFEDSGQRVRMCDTIFSQRMANCLDISLLYASCLEAVGIHPILVIIKGHAFAGGWLTNESFPDSVNDDISLLTKRTAAGINEIVLVEGTLMNAGNSGSFDDAVKAANASLNENKFLLFIDIRRARFSGIRPLPLRVLTADGLAFIDAPIVNRNSLIPEEIVSTAKLVEGKVEITKKQLWERKLLDLTLRNNLLNLRITKNTVQLLFTQIHQLEDELVAGKEFQILPKPTDWDNPHRQADVYQTINITDPITDLINNEFTQKRLRTYLNENDLNSSLINLYRTSRLSLEENGANTLYISLGMLKWFETSESERPRYAPILLMPVEILRKTAQKGFIIRTREEETMLNITLLEMLRQDFGITIGGLETLPKDESGIDVLLVFNTIRQAIMSQSKWDVEDQIFLGIFSFSKFIMWNDIHKNTALLSQNKIVSSLISGKIEWEIPEETITNFDFDAQHHPATIVLPISADSSQLDAITASVKDKSFVLHGPPGTGKSQTITNIISNALYNGKRVLFVAEKMAALSVVRDRLEKIGLGPFCLELHSNKSKKSAVLEQLKRTAAVTKIIPPENFRAEAERLHLLRAELNEYVSSLHKKYPFGLSVYDCFTGDAQLEAISGDIKFSTASLEILVKTVVTNWDDISQEIQAAGALLPQPFNHPLQLVNKMVYSKQLKIDSTDILNKILTAFTAYGNAINELCIQQKIDTPISSAQQLAALNSVVRLLLILPDIPAILFNTNNVEMVLGKLLSLCDTGTKRDVLKNELLRNFREEIVQVDAPDLLTQWNIASNKWFIPKYFQQRKISTLLTNLSLNGKVENENIISLLQQIIACKNEQQIINTNETFLAPLLDFYWNGGACDWQKIVLIANSIIHINKEIIVVTGSVALAAKWRENLSRELMEGANNFIAINGKLLEQFSTAHLKVAALEANLKELLSIDFDTIKPTTGNYLTDTSNALGNVLGAIEQLKDWVSWLNVKDKAIKAGLEPVISAYENGEVESKNVAAAYKKGLYRSCANYIIEKEPALSLFNGKLFEEKIKRFRVMSAQFEQLTKDEIYARLAAKIPEFSKDAAQASEIGFLKKTIANNGRAMPIRKLFDSIPNLLPRIAPCILMSPISVAQYFDAAGPKFDLVVFDEASQMPTCEAIGAITRANNMIIVGDPKQMPPTSFFSSANNVDEENIEKEDLESILDDCLALSMPSKHLLWHYRSKHESLIAFSNSKYYENKLLTFPSPDDIATKVNFIPVEGYYDRGKTRQNSFEAKAVIEEIKRRLSDPILSKKSIGVVSFSSVQQLLMQNMLDELFRTNPELEAVALETAEPIFIKNLENVQGDERDIILFSVGYGPDKEGKVSLNFGPLNRDGGWRRLNVAITRARYQMIVYSTLRSHQIDITRSASTGVADIKAFLEYAEKGRSMLSLRKIITDVNDHAFENILAQNIRKNGYEVHTNVGCSGYKIDIAIVNKEKPSQYILGILCDGNNYKSAKTAKDREIIQQEVLSSLGWTLHKIWSADWWENAHAVMKDTLQAIADAEANKDIKVDFVSPPVINNIMFAADNSNLKNRSTAEIFIPAEPNLIDNEYIICELQIMLTTSSEDFLQQYNKQKIKDQINLILETEAPIMRNLLTRRVLAAWGITKMGTRIYTHFDLLINECNITKTGNDPDAVYWNSAGDAENYNGFRVSTSSGVKRDAEDLPAEEIANGVKHILGNQISLPMADLIRETAKVFGFARSGTNVEIAIKKGIALAIEKNIVLVKDGRVVYV